MSITSKTPKDPAEAAPAAAGTTAETRTGRNGWQLLVRMHFYAGVFVAPFLLVAAVTGLLYAFSPQFDQLMYGDKLGVADPGGEPRPLSEQVRAARADHPEGTVATVVVPGGRDETTQVVLDVEGLAEDRQRTVYVDPYTATVKGELTTWFGTTPLRTWLDNFHRHLNLGETGRLYSELAASWLWVLLLGGLTLWLARGRTYRGADAGRRRRLFFLPDRSAAKGVRRTRGWHAATGIWLAVGLLGLSATGLTWSTYAGERFSALLDTLGATAPELDTTLAAAGTGAAGAVGGTGAAGTPGTGEGSGHHPGGSAGAVADPAADVDKVLATARGAGLAGPVELAPPAEANTAWSVSQTDNVWPVHRDSAAVDPATGQVTARADWADRPALSKLSSLGIQAHMGILFGIVNQVLLAALAAGLLLMIFWGYRMWWQRRPTRADRRALVGRPPARGAWRQLPLPAVAGVVVAGLAVGWAVPLLGVTLLAFLVLDVALGQLARYRSRPAAG